MMARENAYNQEFAIPYSQRFEAGEFRKRVQFMYGGGLIRARFRYTGPSVEAVLDRLPTAEVKAEQDGSYLIEAEVFGSGIVRWLLSQGKYVEVLEPADLREKITHQVQELAELYLINDHAFFFRL